MMLHAKIGRGIILFFSAILVFLLSSQDAFPKQQASFAGRLKGADSFIGDGTFSGSSAYVQLWLDGNGDGLSAPVPGESRVGDDLLIREAAILDKTGVFVFTPLDSTDGLVPGVYRLRAIASPSGSPGISTFKGTDGEEAARVPGVPGFSSAPAVTAIYGDAAVTLDGKGAARIKEITDGGILTYFPFDPEGSARSGTIVLSKPYPGGS